MPVIKKISLALLVAGYIAAGLNHFRIPAFYIAIIPPYFPHPAVLNYIAGVAEIVLGLLLIFKRTRTIAAWGIILILAGFLPVHIYMLNKHTQLGTLTVSPLTAWLRLLLQPVLMFWAWWTVRNGKF